MRQQPFIAALLLISSAIIALVSAFVLNIIQFAHPLSLSTNIMRPCSDFTAGAIKPIKVFRIYVGEPPIAGSTIAGPVKFSPPNLDQSGNDVEADEEQADKSVTGTDNVWHQSGNYPFHVNIAQISSTTPANIFVMIRVILPNTGNYKFTPLDESRNTLDGIGVGEKATDSNLCKSSQDLDQYIIPGNPNNPVQTAIFYAKIGKPSGKEPEPFNIVIEGAQTLDTPIVIDPKVHQPG
jgi:hypothetical protein